jgi:probable HAF family extracellular repeat protein
MGKGDHLMKRKIVANTLLSLGVILALAAVLPIELTFGTPKASPPRYRLIDVGTFGGPASYFSAGSIGEKVLNNQGTLAGAADTAMPDPDCLNGGDCFITHAFRRQGGALTDLGSLPGGDFSLSSTINARGWISGTSANGDFDPFAGVFVNHAVLWEANQIIDLGTLGTGLESQAFYVTNSGQVVGQSTINTDPDPFSFWNASIHTFIWQNGAMRDLGTLGGPDAFPTEDCSVERSNLITGQSLINDVPNPDTGFPTVHPFLWQNGQMIDLGTLGGTILDDRQCVNNRGQVAGGSFLVGNSIIHPFLWEHGVLKDLGTLGGDNGFVRWINDAGEIVGNADLPGSQNHHAFLWRNGTMIDLGTLGSSSTAHAINSHSQVVGRSKPGPIGTSDQHAFLWENGGPMVDLNTVIAGNSTLELFEGLNINDRGEIMGLGLPPGCDDVTQCGHVFLLIPCHAGDGCENAEVATAGIQNSAALLSASSAHAPSQAHRQSVQTRLPWSLYLQHFYQVRGLSARGN